MVRLLIHAKADVNAANKLGQSALTEAKNDAIVRLLKAAGAK